MIFLTFLLISGCTRVPSTAVIRDGLPVINIEKSLNENNIFYLSDIARKIEYIPLEFTPECAIKRVDQLYASSGDIFVLSNGDLFRFGINGKFLNKVGRRGRGPGEYERGRSFAVDTVSEHIYINSNGHRLIVYDYQGQHIRTMRGVDRNQFGFYFLHTTKELAFMGDPSRFLNPDNFFVKITDTLGNPHLTKKGLLSSLLKENQQTWWQYSSYQYKDSLFVMDGMSDTVFYFHNNQLVPYLMLDLGRHKVTLDALLSADYQEATARYFRPYIHCITSNYIFFSFRTGSLKAGRYHYTRYDKITGEYSSGKTKIVNDIDGGMNGTNHSICAYDAIDMIETLTPGYLSGTEAKDPEARQRLVDLVGNLTDNDNPVIMKITFK